MSALREILAIFSTEIDDSGLKKGEKGVEGFKKTLGEFGTVLAEAFAIKEIVEFGREILEQADVLAKQSQALSVSAAELQGWQWAAKLSGSSAEEFNSAFTKFNRNIAEAAKGTGPAADALKALGVSIKDATGKAGEPIDLLDGVADGLVAMQDPAKRTATIMALFGKSGARLLPLFLEGAEGIKKLRAEVKELGAEFDESFLEDAQEVNDNIDRLKLGFRGLAIQGLKPLLPLIVDWTQKGIALIKSIVGVAGSSNALKAALVLFGTVGAVKAVSAMVTLAQKVGFLKNGLRGLFFELIPLVLAFAALEDIWTFLTGGESETEDLLTKYFGKDAPGKVRAFANALANDFMPIVREAMAIFTDGEPLDTQFKRLDDVITKNLGPGSSAVFGELLINIKNVVLVAQGLIQVFKDLYEVIRPVVEAVEWLGKQTIKTWDADANSDARKRRAEADGTADWRNEFHGRILAPPPPADGQLSWWEQLKAQAGLGDDKPSFNPRKLQEDLLQVPTDPRQLLAQQNVASTPIASYAPPPAPVVNQTLTQNVTQNITAETPADLKRATRDGAKDGLTEGGEYLRTKRALVPSP